MQRSKYKNPYSEFISTPCAMSSSWKIVDLRQGRQKADVFDRMLSRYFFRLQTVCPSSYGFCFVFETFFLSPWTLDFTELYSWPKKDLYSLLLTFLSILKNTKDKVNPFKG